MPEPSRSYADDLRARDDQTLLALLRRRPDLARPAPADVTALAARAATVPSTRRALEHLDAGLLHVLEAVLVAGTSGPTAAALLGTDEAALADALHELWLAGLTWCSSEGMRPARAVGEALTHPAGLGPVASDLGVRLPADIETARAALSETAARVLQRLSWGLPRASFEGPTLTSARDELVEAGLMARLDGGDGLVPREVGLALRGGRLHEQALDPPAATGTTVRSLVDVDAAAGAEALELLNQIEEIARSWETEAPRVLRAGGLAVKDHKAAATLLEVPLPRAAFVIELAGGAGLIATDGDLDPGWLPTTEYDEWRAQPAAHRWAVLAEAWWRTIRAPSLVGERVEGRTVVNVLSEQAAWPLLRTRRRDVVNVLAGLPEGTVPSEAEIADQLRWQRPLRLPAGAPTHVGTVLREAGWLGVIGRGALSAVGRGLNDGLELAELAAVAAEHLPKPVDHVLVQADLTAIAPGPLTDGLARLMRLSADIESRGGATVFRFTSGSVRRALDSGISAVDLIEQLASASRTPLPQPLEYLVADVARRHGQARVGSVGCYVRSDDETALTSMLADRELAPLQLRRIAPTVLVSPVPAGTAMELLRAHSPVAETSDGGLVLARRDQRRANVRPGSSSRPVSVDRLDDADALALLGRLRSREADETRRLAEQEGPPIPSTDATVAVTMLADAAADGAAVWIGYVDETGAVRRALFRPERVNGGRAVGTVEGSAARRTFVIHRITGVAAAS